MSTRLISSIVLIPLTSGDAVIVVWGLVLVLTSIGCYEGLKIAEEHSIIVHSQLQEHGLPSDNKQEQSHLSSSFRGSVASFHQLRSIDNFIINSYFENAAMATVFSSAHVTWICPFERTEAA